MQIIEKDTPKVPAWVTGFLPHFLQVTQPSLRCALDSYSKTLAPDEAAPSYDQVVSTMKRIRVAAARELLQERRV